MNELQKIVVDLWSQVYQKKIMQAGEDHTSATAAADLAVTEVKKTFHIDDRGRFSYLK